MMGIAPSGVHDEGARIFAYGLGKCLWTFLDDDVAPTNLAWHTRVEGSTVGVLRVAQRRNDNVGLETRFALKD